MNRMQKRIEFISLITTIPISIIGFVIFKDKNVLVGIWIGCCLALIGFRMIVQMAKMLDQDEEGAKKQGYRGYVFRYFMYGSIMLVCAYVGVPVLSILAGMMCHKVSLFIYSAFGKEDA